MSINLNKGETFSFNEAKETNLDKPTFLSKLFKKDKKQSSLDKKLYVGLGWDENKSSSSIDCDASAYLLSNGKVVDVVSYKQLMSTCGAIKHFGDNLTGGGDGDDEMLSINLDGINERVDKIIITVNIYEAFEKNQHFGMINNSFVRVFKGKKELVRYDLKESFDNFTFIHVAEFNKNNDGWTFTAIGKASKHSSIGSFKNSLNNN